MMHLLKRFRPRYLALAAGAALVALTSACAGESRVPPSSMEVVQGSYLHLAANITDLRTRVTSWQKGDADSLGVAKEKLERIGTVLASTGWPQEMKESIDRARAAVDPMDRALKAEDTAAADRASAEFGEASHDVVHQFYYDYLPAMEGMAAGSMSAHVAYLDLAANVADLQTRIASWQKGDEGSLGIAREKAERIEILAPHLYSTGVVVRDLPPIQRALPAVFAAIERKDAAAAAQAARPIIEAGGVLGRDFYTWMELERAGADASCVQASYLDLTRNISDLRAGVAAWGKGDAAGLATAREKLARIELLLDHTAWPIDLSDAINRAGYAAWLLRTAMNESNRVAAESASAEFGEASHDVTHEYYGSWLPGGGLQGTRAQASAQRAAQTSGAGAHGHDGAEAAQPVAEGPNWGVIGGFAAVMALVVFGAALTKPRSGRAGERALPQAEV